MVQNVAAPMTMFYLLSAVCDGGLTFAIFQISPTRRLLKALFCSV
jgi:hypothetical protein